jgi:WhiB family transcriptional regulator, redox-sensing transcriptional regulator
MEIWRENAACLDADPEIFFPVAGGNGLEAKRVCERCPVIEECLEYALDSEIEEGVWGGLSAIQRIYTLRKRRKAA